jgi:uncharacterized protein (DUF305 family)
MSRRWVTGLVVGLVALAAGVGIGAAIWAGGGHSDAMDGSGGAMADVSSDVVVEHGSGSRVTTTATMDEGTFLEQMVPHHEAAIAMATLAVEKARRPQIRELGRGIIAAQQKEIAAMEARHREWFGRDLEAATTGPHANVDMDMAELERARGDDFDRLFLAAMIPHHASAITMCERVMMGSPREQISALSRAITAAQAKEIGRMQEWRERWFPPIG